MRQLPAIRQTAPPIGGAVLRDKSIDALARRARTGACGRAISRLAAYYQTVEFRVTKSILTLYFRNVEIDFVARKQAVWQ